MKDGWAKITQAAQYAGVSVRTLRKWLRMGLRHSRVPGGTVLISYKAIDEFLQKHEVQDNEIDKIVDEVMRDFSLSKK